MPVLQVSRQLWKMATSGRLGEPHNQGLPMLLLPKLLMEITTLSSSESRAFCSIVRWTVPGRHLFSARGGSFFGFTRMNFRRCRTCKRDQSSLLQVYALSRMKALTAVSSPSPFRFSYDPPEM